MAVKITHNIDSIVAGIKALVNGIPIAAKQSSKIIANKVLYDSLYGSYPTCPKDTGALRSTGRVEAVQEGYAVIYGGETPAGGFVDYAAYVHDDLRDRKYTLPGSGPKFVEAHMLDIAEDLPEGASETLQELVDDIERTYR
jgi:hypothetical protein